MKINNLLECPFCKSKEIKTTPSDKQIAKETKFASIIETDRSYMCQCKNCQKLYQIDYGKSVLKKYHKDSNENIIGDIKIYVSYDSNYDTSYKIVKTNDVMMIITNNDEYPIVINNDKNLINSHEVSKKLIYTARKRRYK